MNYEQKYKEFQIAKERAEQHSFPFIVMFDGIVEKQYNDLKSNYTKEHEELFCKNKEYMNAKITYMFPIGPIDSDEIEYTEVKEITTEEYMNILNHPNDILNIEIIKE